MNIAVDYERREAGIKNAERCDPKGCRTIIKITDKLEATLIKRMGQLNHRSVTHYPNINNRAKTYADSLVEKHVRFPVIARHSGQ
tara:strand:+ start:129 stop:383 length:255 start_codon:yes stop_codon:yes gene_type:complete